MTRAADGPPALRVGTFVPQGWKLEYAGWSASDAWERSRVLAQRAETLGYDHLWVYDHVETVPRREPEAVFEAFTLLAAVAQHTTTVGLGQLVTCASYRNAGLLAKEAACLDVLSGGRLVLGLGAGWYDEEYRSYGFEFLPDRDRLAALDETLAAVRRLWTEEAVTFTGRHVRLDGAHCEPKPLQTRPELWVGGGGEQVTLRIAARHADATNWQVGLDGFVRKSELLDRYCDEIGRDPATIERTHGPDCAIFDSDADLRAWLASPAGGDLWDEVGTEDYVRDNLIGTVEQVTEKAQAFVDAGCRGLVLWLRDLPSAESLVRFATEVRPALSLPVGSPT